MPMKLSRASLLVLAISALVLLPGLGLKPFFTRGEPREALVAQSMFVSGDYVLPEGYGGTVPSKPPALHWGINLFAEVLGQVSEAACRLPSAIAAIAFSLLLFQFLLPRKGKEQALLSVLLLLGSFEWFRAATVCRVDMVLAVTTGVGLLSLFRWFERGLRGVPLVAVIMFAAATLAKGPVGLALPGLIFGLHLLLERVALRRILVAGTVVFLPAALLASLWYLLAYQDGGQAFLQRVYDENINRMTGQMDDDPHDHSAPYLYAMLLVGLMPWTLILGLPLLSFVRKPTLAGLREWWGRLDAVSRHAVLVSAVFVLFYSIPSSKRGVYLLPAYPFLCVLLSSAIFSVREKLEPWLAKLSRVLAWTILGGSAVVAAIIPALPDMIRGARESRDGSFAVAVLEEMSATSLGVLGVLALLLPSAIALVVIVRRRSAFLEALQSLLALVFASYLAVDAGLLPPVARELAGKEFASEVAHRVPPDQKIYSFENEFYGTSFYLGRRITRLEDYTPSEGFVLLYERNLSELEAFLKAAGSSTATLETLARSPGPIVRPGRHVLLVRYATGAH